ncbi:MAG TPA: nucleotidyltransferase family protein [Bacteroidales bacterium]|nr:nucleotidyltransferase family protein [Bacteroidales bacterium]
MVSEDKIKGYLVENQYHDADFIDVVLYHSLQHWFYFKLSEKNTLEKSFILPNLMDELKKNKQSNLLLYSEWRSIWNLAKEKNIKLFLYKGLALSEQLYGDALIRASRDLDIFVDFSCLSITHDLLLSLGYKRVKPDFDLNEIQLRQIKNHLHHFSYYHTSKKVLVELHWQLFVPLSIMKNSEILFNNIINNFNDDLLPHYKPEVLLHYLMIHAAMHHWHKLGWLSDMDTLVRQNKINWQEFDEYTCAFDDERMVNVSIQFLINFFETPIPNHKSLNKQESKIYKLALKSIEQRENYLSFKGIKRIKRAYFLSLLKSSLTYKFYCWYAPMTNLEDWKTMPLPGYLFGFYILFRPFLWFYHNYLKKK